MGCRRGVRRRDWGRLGPPSPTTTAGCVRLFIGDTAGTPVISLMAEVTVAAATPSATVRVFSTTLVFDRGLILPASYTLRASTHNAEAFNVIVIAGDY